MLMTGQGSGQNGYWSLPLPLLSGSVTGSKDAALVLVTDLLSRPNSQQQKTSLRVGGFFGLLAHKDTEGYSGFMRVGMYGGCLLESHQVRKQVGVGLGY